MIDDMNMCLPWFKGSDHRCASCFTVLLQERGIIQETFDFKVEGFVEDVGTHLCDMRKLCFVNADEGDTSTIAVFIPFQKKAYTSTRNATRNLYHVRDSSSASVLWKFRE
jgi:hypothetical protein